MGLPNEKSLANLKKGNKFKCDDSATIKAREKSHESQRRNIAMRKAVKAAMARAADDLFSYKQIHILHMGGVETEDQTVMDVCITSLIAQAAMGNTKATKLIMELMGEDNAAEQRKIERERLALEREKMEQEARSKSPEEANRRFESIIEAVKRIE